MTIWVKVKSEKTYCIVIYLNISRSKFPSRGQLISVRSASDDDILSRRHDRTACLLARKIDNNPMNLLWCANKNAVNHGESPRCCPGRRLQGSPTRIVDNGCAPNAVFISHPGLLHELWREYMEGSGCNKAAKYCTSLSDITNLRTWVIECRTW